MATSCISKLCTKRIKADVLLTGLKSKLSHFEEFSVKQYCKKNEEILTKENEKLRSEIAILKANLVKAEIMNGKKQVALPSSTSIASSGSSSASDGGHSKPNQDSKPKADSVKKQKKDATKKKSAAPPPVEEGPLTVAALDLRVGEIVDVRRHEDADSLYVEMVDLGEARLRVVISGLVKHVPIEQMKRRCIFVCNMKPSKMRGIISEAMVMCASSPDKTEIITPPEGSNIGDRIYVKGYEGTPLAQLNPKKKIFEAIKPDLRINDAGVATYKGEAWLIAGNDNHCTVKHVVNAQIS